MVQKLVTDHERAEYGDEALSVMGRRAREVIEPAVQQLSQQNQILNQKLQRLQANDVYAALDRALPSWRQINRSEGWLAWLRQPHEFARASRQQLLDDAFASGDARRVVAIIEGYLRETSQSAPQAASHVWSTRSMPSVGDNQIIPRKAIQDFYDTISRNPNAYTAEQKA